MRSLRVHRGSIWIPDWFDPSYPRNLQGILNLLRDAGRFSGFRVNRELRGLLQGLVSRFARVLIHVLQDL